MLIAHIPAGYIVTKSFNKVRNENILFINWYNSDFRHSYIVSVC